MRTKRGPASAAGELVTVAPIEIQKRIKAPHDLSDEEVEVWCSVVDSMPSDWFTPATVPLLSQYCRHSIHARRISELIEKATSDPKLKIQDYERLLRMQKVESDALAMLAVKMRIAQHSVTNHRGNSTKASKTYKPWEG